jgi:hypothetical protein
MTHPKTLEAYRAARYDVPESVADNIEREFKRQTQGSIIERQVTSIYRVKRGDRDYIWYRVIDKGQDYLGNPITWEHEIGRYEYPNFTRSYDQATGRPVVTNLAGKEWVYEIPFSVGNMQKIVRSSTVPGEMFFALDAGFQKFAGTFNGAEFMTRHFDDLMEKAMHGKFPDVPRHVESDEEVAKYRKRRAAEDTARRKRSLLLLQQERGIRPILARPLAEQPQQAQEEEEEKLSSSPSGIMSEASLELDSEEMQQSAQAQPTQQSAPQGLHGESADEIVDLSDIPDAILNQPTESEQEQHAKIVEQNTAAKTKAEKEAKGATAK